MGVPVSFWEQKWADKADIVVVGAGLVGLQSAIQLKKKFSHRKVWIVEAATMGSPASLRNAGFACFGSMGEILDDAQNIGIDAALSLYENRYKGFLKLKENYGEVQIGYENSGGYEIFQKHEQPVFDNISEHVDEINQQLHSVHHQIAFQLKNSVSLGMNVLEKTIFSPPEGAIQTHLLYETVRKHALSLNIEIFSGFQLTNFEQLNSEKWKLSFANSTVTFTANELVICTNGFTQKLLPMLDVQPARGQVIVTKSIPSLPFRGIFHYDKGYIYFRSLGTRILIGGARNLDFDGENTMDQSNTPFILDHLLHTLENIVVPGIKPEIEYQWAGTMGMSANRTPIIETLQPHLHCCVRMGGMGVALSAIAAEKLAILID
jgi:glycine/D-amino acid oxidase-like deaminating enzyme